jgi:hypothetical protein
MRACAEGWLKAYVQHMRFSEAPTSFHFWVGVGTIAGALRRKVWTDHLTYQYTPNFYIILVAPPGVATKSTAIRAGTNLLRRVKGVHIGPQSLTWQALFDSLKISVEVVKVPGTTQVLAYSALTLPISELGTFFRPENKEFMDHLTNIWDAQKEVVGRKTLKDGEILIENPWLNIIAGTTPGWLKDNFPKVMIEGGLASRLIFVFQDKKQRLIAYPERLDLGASFKLEQEALLYDLQQIGNLCGQYKFTDAAYTWGERWYESLHDIKPAGLSSAERMQGYLSRKQALVHKLAMVLAAGRGNELILDEPDLIEAEANITALETNISQVFDSIGVTPEANIANDILHTIQRHDKVSYKKLYQAFTRTIDGITYKRVISHLLEAGLIEREAVPGDFMLKFVGRK